MVVGGVAHDGRFFSLGLKMQGLSRLASISLVS